MTRTQAANTITRGKLDRVLSGPRPVTISDKDFENIRTDDLHRIITSTPPAMDVFLCSEQYAIGEDFKRDRFQKVLRRWMNIVTETGMVALHVMRPVEEVDWKTDPANPGVYFRKLGTNGSWAVQIRCDKGPEWHRMKLIVAENLTLSPWYCVTDDDCLPLGTDFLYKAIEQIGCNEGPPVGVALVGSIDPPFPPFRDNKNGKCRFIRRGAAPTSADQWPQPFKSLQYDLVHEALVNGRGYETRYLLNVRVEVLP